MTCEKILLMGSKVGFTWGGKDRLARPCIMSSETEETPQFSVFDLPQLQINSELETSEYSDLEYSTEHSTPATPTKHATPLTELSSSVTSFGFSDVLDATTGFSEPQPKSTTRNVRVFPRVTRCPRDAFLLLVLHRRRFRYRVPLLVFDKLLGCHQDQSLSMS